jgi:hypothetical protein
MKDHLSQKPPFLRQQDLNSILPELRIYSNSWIYKLEKPLKVICHLLGQ